MVVKQNNYLIAPKFVIMLSTRSSNITVVGFVSKRKNVLTYYIVLQIIYTTTIKYQKIYLILITSNSNTSQLHIMHIRKIVQLNLE